MRSKKSRRPKHWLNHYLWTRVPVAAVLPILLGGIGAIYFGLVLPGQFHLQPVALAQPLPLTAPVSILPEVLPRSEPTRLRINGLKLDTSLIPVGIENGVMQIPDVYDKAAWYTLAPTPGERGPAIIAGHVDSYKGPAVFWRLYHVKPGDIIEIDRADSKTVRFTVDKVGQYPRDQLPIPEIYGNLDFAGIRLMTCSGFFNKKTGKYDQTVVVFGTMISEPEQPSDKPKFKLDIELPPVPLSKVLTDYLTE